MISKTAQLSQDKWAQLRGYSGDDPIAGACADSNFSPGVYPGLKNESGEAAFAKKRKVALWDFGDGFRASKLLSGYGFIPIIINHNMSADEVIAKEPDGIMLSGGPGDPAANPGIVCEIKNLCAKIKSRNIPVIAVGLGHQLLALANGAKTEKMKFGNRGANVPVLEHDTGRVFVTEQNHGYAVIPGLLPANAVISHSNINDGTCEGLIYKDMRALSVQFDPTDAVVGRFTAMMSDNKQL